MSLETQINKVILQGNAATTVFPYTFIIPNADVVVATFTDDEGTQTVLSTSQYTITGLDDADGGTVTYPLSGSPMAVGESLTIERIVPYTQPTVLTNQGGYYPDVVEGADDWIVMQTQQLYELFGRSIRYPAVDESPNAELPAAILRIGMFLAFDADGNVTVSEGTGADAGLRTDLAATTGSSLVGFIQSGSGATGTTDQANQRLYINVQQFGAVGNSSGIGNGTDDYTAITNAVARAAGRILYFPYTGNGYRIGTNLTIPANVGVKFDNSAVLYPNAGVAVTYSGLIGQSLNFTVGDRTEHAANGILLNQIGSAFQITGGAGASSITRVALYAAAQTGGGGTNGITAQNNVAQQNNADALADASCLELNFNNNKADDVLSPASPGIHSAISIISGGSKIVGPAAVQISVSAPGTNDWRRGFYIRQSSIASGGYAFDYAGNAGGNSDFKVRADGFTMIGTATVGAGSGTNYMFSMNTQAGAGAIVTGSAAGNACYEAWNRAEAGDNTFHVFYTEGAHTARGSITYNRGGGVTAFNTTSDYRLKELKGRFEDSGKLIDGIKVHLGRMCDATLDMPMFVAHELQDVAPWAVTGEKDAVGEKGEIIPQQVDKSSLVPLLLAEIQDLRRRLEAAGIK